MNKFNIALILLILFCAGKIFSQQYILSGTIKDKSSGERLPFATLKVEDTAYGTTADKDGFYILRLKSGDYRIKVSYIGYSSQISDIKIDSENKTEDITLEKLSYSTEEIQVLGEDPAIDIIRNAIVYKNNFLKNLGEYNYDAYSKVILRTNLGEKDSANGKDNLAILGIMESETKGYVRPPDEEKQIVISKRETANISKGFIIPLIVNFYEDKIDLGGVNLPGIISNDCFDSYEYKLKSILYQDSNRIFKIEVKNKSNITAQFFGEIYVVDSLYALKKIVLNTNEALNMRGIDNLRFEQKFLPFRDRKKNEFWMPTDVQIYADGQFAGVIRFKGDVYTIINSYNINEKAPAGVFDDYIVKVLPDAEKDSVYWSAHLQIKNSEEEQRTYKKIEDETKKKKKSVNFGIGNINIGQKFYINYLDVYKFNKAEGHVIQLDASYGNMSDRIRASVYGGYGFNDKKPKYEIMTDISLLKSRALRLSFDGYRLVKPIFRELEGLGKIENTIRTIVFKEDLFDYYYSGGFNIKLTGEILPQLKIYAVYNQEKNQSAIKTSDFSIFTPHKPYPDNIPIYECFSSSLGGGVIIDPNEYKQIDWGDGTKSKVKMTMYPELKFDYLNSGSYIGSNFENRKYSLYIEGYNNFNSFINIRYKIGGEYFSGDVPYQYLGYFTVPTISNSVTELFYTMNYREYAGDRLYRINFENDFGKLIFGNIPILKKFSFIGFFNAGRSFMSDRNSFLLPDKALYSTDGIYAESGFAIGRILEVMRVNFAWRLNNYKPGENFRMLVTIDGF